MRLVKSTFAVSFRGRWDCAKAYGDGDGAVEGAHTCVVIQFIPIEEVGRAHRPSTVGVVNRRHNTYSTSDLTVKVVPNQVKLQSGAHKRQVPGTPNN